MIRQLIYSRKNHFNDTSLTIKQMPNFRNSVTLEVESGLLTLDNNYNKPLNSN